jgi:hypothetical protein
MRGECFAIFTLEKKVIFRVVLGCSDLQSPYIPPRVHKGVDVALATIQSFRWRVVLTPGDFPGEFPGEFTEPDTDGQNSGTAAAASAGRL